MPVMRGRPRLTGQSAVAVRRTERPVLCGGVAGCFACLPTRRGLALPSARGSADREGTDARTTTIVRLPGLALLERPSQRCAGQPVEGRLAQLTAGDCEKRGIQWRVAGCSGGRWDGPEYAADSVAERGGWLTDPEFASPGGACLGIGCQGLDALGRDRQRLGQHFRP